MEVVRNLTPTAPLTLAWLRLRNATPERAWEIDEGKFWGLAFSRDGKQIAYATHENGLCEIRVVGTDGRGMRVIASLDNDAIVSEVHGFSRDDRHVVFGIARSAAEPELWAARLDSHDAFDSTQRMARGFFFGGFADQHDAIYVWDRATGERRTYRVGFEGDVVPVPSLRLDRSSCLSFDGRELYTTEKHSSAADDRRFSVFRTSLDRTRRTRVANVVTACATPRLSIRASADGAWLHLSAVGTIDGPVKADGTLEPSRDLLSFNLVMSTDGETRRALAARAFASRGRVVVSGDNGTLRLVNARTGSWTPLIDERVDHFTVTRDGRRLAYVSGRRLMIAPIA